MLKFLRSKTYPIGIDLGSDSLKMMQLAMTDRGLSLLAAAKTAVPGEIRGQGPAMQEWYAKQIRTHLAEKPFKGKKVVPSLPARDLIIQHLRMPRMEEKQLVQALTYEAQDKLPFDCRRALLRHVVAGTVYEGSETRQEIILMAASRATVEHYLRMLEHAKVETESLQVEPQATLNGFAHLLQQAPDTGEASMFVDLGHGFTKVMICHGAAVAFCRHIKLGAEHMQQEAARQSGSGPDRAAEQTARPVPRDLHPASSSPAAPAAESDVITLEAPAAGAEAMAPLLQELCEEIRGCVRYHDLLFNSQRVSRTIFLGGLTKNTPLCQQIAKRLNLPAQLGDPLARLDADSKWGAHSDLEPDERQGEWAVAYGLSLGGA